MSDRFSIAAEPRTVVGKKVKQLRREGLVPAVIYGRKAAEAIQLEVKPLRRVLKGAGTTSLIDIELSGKKRTVLARDIQQHVTRGDLIHIDFYEVDMKTAVHAEASLVLIGESQPVKDALGSVVLALSSVDIEALPDALVSEIEVDISVIDTPDVVIHVKDLNVPEGVTVLNDEDTAVARFEYASLPAEEEEGEEEEMTVEDVEVVGQEEEEEEGV